LRRLVAIVVILFIGPIGLLFTGGALGFSKMVLWALWSGVFERPDFRENTGDVSIWKSSAPDVFWANVVFYSIVSLVCFQFAVATLWPLVIYVRRAFRNAEP
jgi:hypothetical protein